MTDARRDPEAGISLIEVLVVLAIVAVTTGATLLALGEADRGAGGETEAVRLAARLQLAADEAMVADVPYALAWDARGYRFIAWDAANGTWHASGQRVLGMRHELPPSLRLARIDRDDRRPIVIAPDRPEPVALRLAGDRGTWRLTFDGLGAAVRQE